MKKQENRPKLVLKKETIARLNNFGMRRIVGGDGETGSRELAACDENIVIATRVGVTCSGGVCDD